MRIWDLYKPGKDPITKSATFTFEPLTLQSVDFRPKGLVMGTSSAIRAY